MAVKSSFRNMTVCLMAICFVCSALLAGVQALTKAPIEAANAAKTINAVSAVLPQCDEVSEKLSINVADAEYAYYEARMGGELVGYAIESATTGFGGTLKLMVGYTTEGLVYGTSALSHAETPGLGAKCTEAKFADQFRQLDPSAAILKVKKDGGSIDAITASTITSRAYTFAVENAVNVGKQILAASADMSNEILEEGGQSNE